MGDYVNAELLGNPQSLMIGNVIQARFLKVNDYPTASALSFILMAAILVGRLHLRPAPRHRGADLMAAASPPDGHPRRRAAANRSVAAVGRAVDRWLLPIYVVGVVLYLILPVVVMIVFSFNDPAGRSTSPGAGSRSTPG